MEMVVNAVAFAVGEKELRDCEDDGRGSRACTCCVSDTTNEDNASGAAEFVHCKAMSSIDSCSASSVKTPLPFLESSRQSSSQL